MVRTVDGSAVARRVGSASRGGKAGRLPSLRLCLVCCAFYFGQALVGRNRKVC